MWTKDTREKVTVTIVGFDCSEIDALQSIFKYNNSVSEVYRRVWNDEEPFPRPELTVYYLKVHSVDTFFSGVTAESFKEIVRNVLKDWLQNRPERPGETITLNSTGWRRRTLNLTRVPFP